MENYDLLFKLCMLGDSGVGKSCIVERFVDNAYTGGGGSTIGAAFGTKTIEDDGKYVKCHVWDTAGQERFRSLTAATIRGSHGAMFVYDITDRESFLAIQNIWVQELDAKVGRDHVVKLLVGNKSDLADKRAVPFHEAQEYAKEAGMPFLETSAKDATNVEHAFQVMVATIRSRAADRLPGNDSEGRVITLPEPRSKKSLCRCG